MAVKYRRESGKRERHIPRQYKALLFCWRSLIVPLWVLFQSGTLYSIFRGALHDWPSAFPFLIGGCLWPLIPFVWFICYCCSFTNRCSFWETRLLVLIYYWATFVWEVVAQTKTQVHILYWMYVDRHAGKAWWLISLSLLQNREDNSLGKVWQ